MPVCKNRQLRLLLKVNSWFTTNFSMPIIVWSLAGSAGFGLVYAVIYTVNPDLAIAIEQWCQQLEISFLNPANNLPAPNSIFIDNTLNVIKVAFLTAISMVVLQTFSKKNS